MAKYTNALYPDKINDLVDNDGNVNGGGTQLYRHDVEVDGYDAESKEVHTTCIFVTSDERSLKGLGSEVYSRGYVSGVINIYGSGAQFRPLLNITSESEFDGLLYMENDGNIGRIDFDGFGNDTVTKL